MRVLYFDCGMGAAGDMLTAALLELMPDPEGAVEKLNAMGIPHVEFVRENASKCGVSGTYMRVLVHGHEEGEHHGHSHSDLGEISSLIAGLNLPEKVKKDAAEVYRLIAQAESRVHGEPVEHVHFHEVGALDAVADVAAVCLLVHELAPERIAASPVHVGAGTVSCAHGILPVPAPATAVLLEGIPCYGGKIRGELCTPTGAALLRYFARGFGDMPVISWEKIGYGMGKKDFSQANCIRAFLGEEPGERVWSVCCNLDDMTGEEIAYAVEKIEKAGAEQVFYTPIGMKKGRPGVMLTAICSVEKREDTVEAFFLHTTTLGVRMHSELRVSRFEGKIET